jgi:hypothetical protein
VSDHRIDEAFERAARPAQAVSAELLDRIAGPIRSTLSPVSPVPSPWALAGGLMLIALAVALLGALRAGFQGLAALDALSRLVIFGTLTGLLVLVARQVVAEWTPGSPRALSPAALLISVSCALLIVFAALFHDYHVQRFVSAGVVCLLTGLLHAIPAGLLSWWLLRRGYAVDSVAAGMLAGIFGGVVGVTMLELHCPNFEAPHLLVWHTLVVPVSGVIGMLAGFFVRERSLR